MNIVQEFQLQLWVPGEHQIDAVLTDLPLPEGFHFRDLWPVGHLWAIGGAPAADNWYVKGRVDFRKQNGVVLSIPFERGQTNSPGSGTKLAEWPYVPVGPGPQPSMQFYDTQANAQNPIVPCERYMLDCDQVQLFIESINNRSGINNNYFILGLRCLTTLAL